MITLKTNISVPNLIPLQINQLEADLLEISNLLEKAERERVQDVLKQEQKKVEKEISAKRLQKEQQAKREDPTSSSKAYTVKINNYGNCFLVVGDLSIPVNVVPPCLLAGVTLETPQLLPSDQSTWVFISAQAWEY